MRKEFRAATLREKLDVTRALMALGYYPYNIKFNCEGGLALEARQLCGNEEERIKEIEKEIAECSA